MPTAHTIKHHTKFISLKTLAEQWDCSRNTVTRILEEAGVIAYYLRPGCSATKRYLKRDIDRFLNRLERDTT